MYKLTITAAAIAATSGIASAAPGVIDTERFGYAGEVTRHATLADAQAGANVQDTISVVDRDLSLFFANGDTSVPDANIALGSWWHTLDENFGPGQGRAGWGNTTGNTGVGYMQLFDNDGSTDSSVDMQFTNFDGTFYRDFTLNASGSNAGASDFSRFSAIDNVNDGGIWHTWNINLTATGLEGVSLSPTDSIIEATNQPTGVSGSITGIFEITENDTSPANQGFYAVSLDLNMINWAWDNRASLTPQVSQDGGDSFFDGTFQDSFFRTVPTPGAAGLLGIAGIAATRRRR
jgi:MYXO-CTERM domain-containing protein